MRRLIITLIVFAISACGLFDYSHIPKEWETIAKAQCKKERYKIDQNANEETNYQLCINRKVSELKNKYKAKPDKNRKLVPKIGFKFGLVFDL